MFHILLPLPPLRHRLLPKNNKPLASPLASNLFKHNPFNANQKELPDIFLPNLKWQSFHKKHSLLIL